ncbi:trehalose-phosphatase [Lonsdalea quercina]|uniref:Trehalose 6-phosphate phosphatase n=1 Tax=Lonsdalea quercina TaxID=71657 RepID=A0A1H4EGE1_9GAMM|nr:trehalose-phosphatase [Lonsdalea quercina]SEA83788.1 trehalose 6-phosphatase [Lonsdalea quercina]
MTPENHEDLNQPDSLPALRLSDTAFFFDIDGTLAEICARPEDTSIPLTRLSLLRLLFHGCDGAVGIISGRRLADIDGLLAPLLLPAAGVHGGERRRADGTVHRSEVSLPVELCLRLKYWVSQHPDAFLEAKGNTAVALHYRQCPQFEPEAARLALALIEDYPQWAAQQGKCVVEIKPENVNKGRALRAFMTETPFQGRTPVFVGDDLTDEQGFDAAQALGGIAIKIGAGPTCARHRLASVDAVGEWLSCLTSFADPPCADKAVSR